MLSIDHHETPPTRHLLSRRPTGCFCAQQPHRGPRLITTAPSYSTPYKTRPLPQSHQTNTDRLQRYTLRAKQSDISNIFQTDADCRRKDLGLSYLRKREETQEEKRAMMTGIRNVMTSREREEFNPQKYLLGRMIERPSQRSGRQENKKSYL